MGVNCRLDTALTQKQAETFAPICGAFLRCALLARLPIYTICLHSLCCYALNGIHI
ncbi:Uncharacterised protein [Neisseria zoodegmatis]|uniref:Uncharacterized protein n=1 Tax=Neisseria zoodegmatis TaxID=326523 RepID=A0A378WV04_9NEIS|nr:Uncharacterised protein [Neisseria zoodegmatis]